MTNKPENLGNGEKPDTAGGANPSPTTLDVAARAAFVAFRSYTHGCEITPDVWDRWEGLTPFGKTVWRSVVVAVVTALNAGK